MNGSFQSPTGLCFPPYSGNLCAGCASGYAQTPKGECTQCFDNSQYWIEAGLTMFIALILLANLIRFCSI